MDEAALGEPGKQGIVLLCKSKTKIKTVIEKDIMC